MSEENKITKLSESEMRNCLLGVMDAIHEFCTRRKINYSLAYGTLLGAVRHKGFIPWDDDMDIIIARKDYNTFVEEFNKDRNDSFKFISRETDRKYYLQVAKVIDCNTSIQELEWAEEIGCYVDVFVADNLTNDLDLAKDMLRRIRRKKRLVLPFQIADSKKRSCIKNLALKLIRRILRSVNYYDVLDSISSIAREHENEPDARFCGAVMLQSYGEREIMLSDWFKECIPAEFEGREYFITPHYDKILSQLYGDYMTPPPASLQISHHAITAFWKSKNKF